MYDVTKEVFEVISVAACICLHLVLDEDCNEYNESLRQSTSI